MQVLFGILPDSHEHLDGASHTDTQGFIPVFGDYSIDVEVSKGSESWNHPKMTISGDTVGWTGKSTGPASPDGWIALSGNANDLSWAILSCRWTRIRIFLMVAGHSL